MMPQKRICPRCGSEYITGDAIGFEEMVCDNCRSTLPGMCHHTKTHTEDWPDGGAIEICDYCGKSRYLWEQGESSWIMVEDIPEARKEIQEALDKMSKRIEKK